jgi:hypothetical protein
VAVLKILLASVVTQVNVPSKMVIRHFLIIKFSVLKRAEHALEI